MNNSASTDEHTNHQTSHHSHDHSMMNHDSHDHSTMNHNHHGHGTDHSGHELMFRNRFWVNLILTIPVLLFSPMIQMWLGFTMPEFWGSEWIAPFFGVIIFLYGGLPFLGMAIPE
ncbi:MAG: heavy metal translocating P-type ATPase, partial [Anaerolineae bacterium]|nr:heavy metal translocating P-type ATPase [Anaerolineae bacterium]